MSYGKSSVAPNDAPKQAWFSEIFVASLCRWGKTWLFGGTAKLPRQMQVLETLALGGRRQIFLVACGGQRFLVAGGADSLSSMTPLDAEGKSAAILLADETNKVLWGRR